MMRARSLSTVLLLFLSIPFSARAQMPGPERSLQAGRSTGQCGSERRNPSPAYSTHWRDHSSLRQQRIA